MKIGIITINCYYNYGNRLQNYALQKFLEKKIKYCKVETIWYTKDNFKLNEDILSLDNLRRYIFNRHGYRDYINNKTLLFDIIREYNIKKFSDRYINTVFDYCIKNDLNDKYDYFIVGSDQVWNPAYLDLQNEFLQFADYDKRIAYAASFGIDKISDSKKMFIKNALEGIKYISVREDMASEIIKGLTGQKVAVVPDPTLLLEKSDWEDISKKPAWYKNDGYILMFFLGTVPKAVREKIFKIAKDYNLKVVNLMDSMNIDYYCSTPEEFLFLIKNCNLMCTDSFHGTVFSIIMQVPFITCSREGAGMNMDSRINTILNKFNLIDRKVSQENNYEINNPFNICYDNINNILNIERQKGEMFLLQALKIRC